MATHSSILARRIQGTERRAWWDFHLLSLQERVRLGGGGKGQGQGGVVGGRDLRKPAFHSRPAGDRDSQENFLGR